MRSESKLVGSGQFFVVWCTTDQLVHCALDWFERLGYDPKGCELYLYRVKSGESLMEARSGADVQIARQI